MGCPVSKDPGKKWVSVENLGRQGAVEIDCLMAWFFYHKSVVCAARVLRCRWLRNEENNSKSEVTSMLPPLLPRGITCMYATNWFNTHTMKHEWRSEKCFGFDDRWLSLLDQDLAKLTSAWQDDSCLLLADFTKPRTMTNQRAVSLELVI